MLLSENLDKLIVEATKSAQYERLNVLRLIKAEFLKYKTAKVGNELTEAIEGNIILKMISSREDSIKQFNEAGRNELSIKEEKEIEILKEFAPKVASDSEIEEETKKAILQLKEEKGDVKMSDMKQILSKVQEKYPTASGKIVSTVLKTYL